MKLTHPFAPIQNMVSMWYNWVYLATMEMDLENTQGRVLPICKYSTICIKHLIKKGLFNCPCGLLLNHRDMCHNHMTYQNLFFHRTHEEEQDIKFVVSFFTFLAHNYNFQILIGHVTAWQSFVVVLTNMWSILWSP